MSTNQESPEIADIEATSLITPDDDASDDCTEPLTHSTPKSKPTAKASLISSVSNMANTIMGSGILALPFAFKSSGILLGCILLVCVAVFQDYTVSLLRRTADITKQRTYGAVALYVMGPKFGIVVDICVALQTFGVCVAYVVITGDLFPVLLEDWIFGGASDWWLSSRAFVMAFFTFGIIFPLCLLKRMDSLKYTSYIAVASIVYLTCYVVWKTSELQLPDDPVLAKNDWSVFLTVPIISLAYTCHFNWLPIRAELERPTKKRQFVVIHSAFLLVSCLYFLVGCFGYITFFEGVHGNILVNYLGNDVFVQIGRVGVTLTVVFSFPILAYSTREALLRTLFPRSYASGFATNYPGPEGVVSVSNEEVAASWRGRKRRIQGIVVGFIICGLAYILALFLEDIGYILGLVGATASTLICYVFPALFYLKLARDTGATVLIPDEDDDESESEDHDDGETSVPAPIDITDEPEIRQLPLRRLMSWLVPRNEKMRGHVVPSIVVMLLGIMFGVVGTYQTLASGQSLH